MTKIKSKVTEKSEEVGSEKYSHIFEKYGKVSIIDAKRILDAEKQLEDCEKCAGLPCQTRAKGWKPVIRVNEFYVDIARTPCKFLIEKKRQEKLDNAFKMAKMPPIYVGKTFADYEVTKENARAVKVAKEFVENPQSGLYIYGSPGTGKTFLAAIVAQELIHAGKTVIFGDVPSLLDDLKDTFDKKNSETLSNLTDLLCNVDILVLDDLGTENPTEWAVERIYTIVNRRYNAGDKPIIVTSNFDPNVLADRLNHPTKKESQNESVTGDRIVSRLLQMCKGITIKGKDRRGFEK